MEYIESRTVARGWLMRLVRGIAPVAAVVLAVLAPGVSNALVREAASGAGTWSGPGPGIPERQSAFSFGAVGSSNLLPCAAIDPCGPQGYAAFHEPGGRPSRGKIICLSIVGQEAFMTAELIRGNLVEQVGIYARDRRSARQRDELGVVPAAGRDCHDTGLRTELRAAATPLRSGDLAVVGVCSVMVCTQAGQPRSASSA